MDGTLLYLAQLLAEFSGQSEDGVKGQRKKPKQQDLVRALRCTMESEVTAENGNNEEEVETVTNRATDDDYEQEFREVFRGNEEFLSAILDPSGPSGISTDHERIDQFTKPKLEEWLGWRGNPTAKKAGPKKHLNLEGLNRAQKKLRLYQYTQQMYTAFPSKCI